MARSFANANQIEVGVASSIYGLVRLKGIRSFVAGDSGETCHLNLLDPPRSEAPTLVA